MAHGQEEGRGKGVAVHRSGALAGPGQELLLDTGDGGDAPEGGAAPVGAGVEDVGLPVGHVAGDGLVEERGT